MERPEAQDAGTIVLTGFDTEVVLSTIQTVVKELEKTGGYTIIPAEYSINNTSWRVLKLILGNSKLSNLWDSIQSRQTQ